MPRRVLPSPLSWLLPVVAGALAPTAAVLLSGRTLSWFDTARLFGPIRPLVVEALRDLRLPLWNPHEALGVPLLAQLMHGVLHPVSVVLALVAPSSGTDALVVVHVALAAVGAALLARQLGASAGAAAVAGLGYGLSGYVLGMSAVLTYLAAGATAPWTVAAVRAASAGPRAVALGAAGVAALHLAGDPQWTVAAATLGLALAAELRGARGLGLALGAIALGTALAAVQLAPGWAMLAETVRGASTLEATERAQWALSPWRLPELVAPGFFQPRPGATVAAPVFQALAAPTRYPAPFVPSIFVGAPLLALAIAGLGAGRLGRVLGGAAAVALWLALGQRLGAEQLLHPVPIWGAFRYAEKLVGPLTLCLAVLAALGTDRLAARGGERAARIVAAAAAVAAVALAAAALRALPFPIEPAVAALASSQLAAGLLHAVAGLALLAALLAGARRMGAAGVAAGAAALVFLQSAAASPSALHAGPPGVVDPAPLQGLRRPGFPLRVVTPFRADPARGPAGLDETDRTAAMESRMGLPSFNVAAGVDQLDTYSGLKPRQAERVLGALSAGLGERSALALRRFAITHVVLASPLPDEERWAAIAVAGGRPVLDVPAWDFRVWEVPHRPWASFAPRALPASSEPEALDALVRAESEGSDAVVVEGAPAATSPGRVLGVARGPERVRVEAEAPAAGLLIVNDAWWPGWVARLDGRPAPILRADGLVRAVPWPAGRHLLELSYEPPELRVGLAVTGLAAVICLILWIVPALAHGPGRRAGAERSRPAAARPVEAHRPS